MGTAGSVLGVSDALRPRGVFVQAHQPARSPAITGGERGAALQMTRRLALEEGVFAGISTGANVVGAHRLAERLGPEAVIVALAVDTGFKYMSVSPYADL